jgi:uncharacterized membrane protein
MEKLLNQFKKPLVLLISLCLFLFLLRIKITGSLFFGFLIWNLFLAIIPYAISSMIKRIEILKTSKIKLIIILFVWLLFLPNAPYIITDFIHLHYSTSTLIWLDIFILFTFSVTGLLLSIISLNDIYKIIILKWNIKFANYFSIVVTFLCGFGIYLGRFLRLNSWDMFTSPITVIKRSLLSINDPKTWFITFAFGSFIYILLLTFRSVKMVD